MPCNAARRAWRCSHWRWGTGRGASNLDRPTAAGPGRPAPALRGGPELRGPDPAASSAVCDLPSSGGSPGRTWSRPRAAARPASAKRSVAETSLRWPIRYRMSQVFRNLLENALAACPDPVEIAFRCGAERPGRAARGADRRAATTAQGWSQEQHKRVFEPFYTTKTQGDRPGAGHRQADRRGPRGPDRSG